MKEKRRKTIFLIIILAVVVRIALFLYLVPGEGPETWEYEGIAKNLAFGDGFKTVYRHTTYYSCTTPLYPFMCAAVYKLLGVNHNAVIFLQIIIAALTCIVIFDLGRRVSSRATGTLAAFLYAVHPGLAIYCVAKLHPLVLDAFLFSLTLWSFMYLREKLNVWRGILVGVIAGACILTRSTVIAFMGAGLAWLLWCFWRKSAKKALLAALVVTAMALVVISPWVIRNFLVHKEFVLTTSADAEVFWRGNNINATGTSHTPGGKILLKDDKVFYNRVTSMGELQQRHFFRKEAVNFIKENPGKFAKLFFKKLYYFWWFSPSSGIFYPSGYLVAYRYMHGTLVIFAVIGLYNVLTRRVTVDFKNFILILLFLLSISFFQSLFYVEGRHRWGIEPAFLIITAIGAVSIFQRIARFKKGS